MRWMWVPLLLLGSCDGLSGWLEGNNGAPAEEAEAKRPQEPGKWRKLRPKAREDLTSEQQEVIAQLEALGYADGTRDVTASSTITEHDRDRAYQGYNLYNSGHAAEAFLTDMDGEVLHSWRSTFAEAFPERSLSRRSPGVNHWRRVKLGADGSLYAIFEGRGVMKLSATSEVIWARDNVAHHDMVELEGGRLAVLTREGSILPEIHPSKPILRDFVEFLGPDGETERRVDLLQALLDSDHAKVFEDAKRRTGDVFHTNSLEFLDERAAALHPDFEVGHLLVSMRNLDAIGVVDLEAGRFVWLHQGKYAKQHDANIMADGRLVLFDNSGRPKGSRVLAYQLPDMKVSWTYLGTAGRPFRSPTLGTVQELPNGNVLITESEGGRAFEVTPSKEIVWEFYNPHRAGDDDEFIAALFEVVRLPADTDLSWRESTP